MLLKEIRTANKLSQQQLADKMGVNRVCVTQVETQVRRPWPAFKKRASEVLETSEAVLFDD